MSGKVEAALIVNTKSRRGKELFLQAKTTLQQEGVNLVHSWEINRPLEVMAKTQEVIERGIPLVIIGGGDGTLSRVTRYFIGSRSTLGVLPLGTGNQFAHELGIAADVGAACRVLTQGQVVEVDVGVAGKDYFLTVATVGLTTLIAQGLTGAEKRRFGRLAYALALARALTQLRPFRATLATPNGTDTFQTLQVVIGSGRYHAGPFPLAPNASITDGKLSAYVVATTSRWGLLRFALNLPGGHQVDLKDVHAFTTAELTLETSPAKRVTVDGEVRFSTPLQFRIAPRALRVMAPQDFAAGGDAGVTNGQ